jgi:hypothetical protein
MCAVEAATSIMRTRNEPDANSEVAQVRPQVLAAPPKTYVVVAVAKVGVVRADVHVVPPFQESCTHIIGVFAVLLTFAFS